MLKTYFVFSFFWGFLVILESLIDDGLDTGIHIVQCNEEGDMWNLIILLMLIEKNVSHFASISCSDLYLLPYRMFNAEEIPSFINYFGALID